MAEMPQPSPLGNTQDAPGAAEAGFSLLALNISLFLFYWNQFNL
jgi:hypothetical protein